MGGMDRTVLVTGASSGIGLATAAALGRRGATVLVHARTPARAAATVSELARGGGRFVPVAADLGSLAGVRALAAQARSAVRAGVAAGGLHALVNNAGAAFREPALSPDGVERTIAVNHLAVAALTTELLDVLRDGAASTGRPSRVVNLSSTMERRGRPRVDDWSAVDGVGQFQAYCDAKLVNLAYTYALARRIAGSGVTVNAADPGNVATRFGDNAGGVFRIFQTLGRPLLASAARGARTSEWLVSDPVLDRETGGYFRASRRRRSSAASRDHEFGEAVFARTAAILAGVG